MAMDGVDGEIKGAQMRFVERELDRGEAGSMRCGSVPHTVLGAGRRLAGGVKVFAYPHAR